MNSKSTILKNINAHLTLGVTRRSGASAAASPTPRGMMLPGSKCQKIGNSGCGAKNEQQQQQQGGLLLLPSSCCNMVLIYRDSTNFGYKAIRSLQDTRKNHFGLCYLKIWHFLLQIFVCLLLLLLKMAGQLAGRSEGATSCTFAESLFLLHFRTKTPSNLEGAHCGIQHTMYNSATGSA